MMQAGRYYVGDLCYILDDEWSEVCRLTIDGPECLEGEFELSDGRRFAMYTTMWGDGSYDDQGGRLYGVDSGTIGCIQVPEDFVAPNGGHIHQFDSDFKTSGCNRTNRWDSDDLGIIQIGRVKICTNPEARLENEHEEEESY